MDLSRLKKTRAFRLANATVNGWLDDNALRLSAALAYYSIFSIAPLLVLSVGLAGLFFGDDAVRGHLYGEIKGFVGSEASAAIQSMVKSASHPGKSVAATLVGLVVLLFGASSFFGQLKDSLNSIWGVKARPGLGMWVFVRERLLSFGMVLAIGFLLLVSFLLTTLLSAFSKHLASYLQMPGWIWGGAGLLLSFAIVSVLFALIFKVLPDVTIQWRHVGIGAGATALLFELGKFGLAYYLGRESTASSFGAAGSVVLLLLWVYYASCILLFGAEFTKVFAHESGAPLRPTALAVPAPGASLPVSEPAPIPAPRRESLPEIFPNLTSEAPPPEPEPGSALGYIREHMAVSLLASLGCGLVAGAISRVIPSISDHEDPKKQLRSGLQMAGIAGAVLLTKQGRQLLKRGRALFSALHFRP